MELFDWYSVALWIGNAITSYRLTAMGSDPTVEQWIGMNLETMLYAGIAAIAFFLVTLIMGGIALNTMAKKAGRKPSALAYLPFGNTYFAGKLAGESNFFGQKMKRAGLYAMLAEIFYSLLRIASIVFGTLLMNPNYFEIVDHGEYISLDLNAGKMPDQLKWLSYASDYTDIATYLGWFLVLVFFCVLFTAFFRKYYARSPALMTILCTILPFRGFTLFAVRNNRPVDYAEYMRRRYARTYGGQGGPYGNYDAPRGNDGQGPDDPFGEFKEQHKDDDNPFSDF